MELFPELSYGKRVVVYYSMFWGLISFITLLGLFWLTAFGSNAFPLIERLLTLVFSVILAWLGWKAFKNFVYFIGLVQPNETERYINDL